MTVKRGKKPWAMACFTIWKAALMRAWEAMMLARVARMNMGKKVPSGRLLQKLVANSAGCLVRYAACTLTGTVHCPVKRSDDTQGYL